MNIVFFGSDEIGACCLDTLHREHSLTGLVTAPDNYKGRGYHLAVTPLKEWAVRNGVPVLQPVCFDKTFLDSLAALNPDVILLVSYGKILPAGVLRLPRLGALNLHPSLLPLYRGAAPIEWVLIRGETTTGITIITMNERIDQGRILIRETLPIEDSDNALTLKTKVMARAPGLFLEALRQAAGGTPGQAQFGHSSYAPKLRKEDGLIEWKRSAREIHSLVRGLIEWPGAFTHVPTGKGTRLLKLWETAILAEDGCHGRPGEISISKETINAACGSGLLGIRRLQLEGKKVHSAAEFLRGVRLSPGTVLSPKS
jgi:methionyl-tRNA formyltransferase